MRKYCRVTFIAANGKNRHVWATDYKVRNEGLARVTFTVVDKYGDEGNPRKEVVFAAVTDIVSYSPARLSLTYAMLEVAHA